ncbi:MAG: hypothetical protein IJ242_13750 [Clostridia bacterium]|nr:hypothetical protein [Clostridia bacterium]
MRKILFLLVLLMFITVSAAAETLYVDNQEADKTDLMRLNMRSQPSAGGSVIASFYTGAEVNVVERSTVVAAPTEEPAVTENPEESEPAGENPEETPEPAQTPSETVSFIRVEIGGIEGYMSEKYLITAEEAEARYGKDSWFGTCRDAEVDLTGMWRDNVSLMSDTSSKATVVGSAASGEKIHMVGIVNSWAYVYKDTEEGKLFGYLPIDVVTETGDLKVYLISTANADARIPLYETPNQKGRISMSLGNGTACFMLFGRGEGEWRRIRVGGVSGWVFPNKKNNLAPLGTAPRSSVPYYPLVMETKTDALLYSEEGDKSKPYMTLGSQMKVEVLGESEDFLYVRTLIGGAGAYDKGDFGYISLDDLSLSVSTSSMGVVQADDEDMPVIVYSGPNTGSGMLGALCGGAQVRLLDYTQTDFVRIGMNDLTGYVEKKSVRILTQKNDPVSDRIAQRGTAKHDIQLLNEPSTQGTGTAEAVSGARVYMLGKFGDWMYINADSTPNLDVTLQKEQTGFVRVTDLNAPASTTHLTASVTTDKVNLRSIADKTGDIIGRVRLGEILRITDYGNQWTCVVTPEGKRGYIMTEYLDFE